jgi:carbon storage regulator
MLFLTRRVGQSLMIGDDVEIVVEEVRGRTVKLGIRHPASVQVLRRELWERIRSENIEAAASVALFDAPPDEVLDAKAKLPEDHP